MNAPTVEVLSRLLAYRITMPDMAVYIVPYDAWCDMLERSEKP